MNRTKKTQPVWETPNVHFNLLHQLDSVGDICDNGAGLIKLLGIKFKLREKWQGK